MVTRFLVGMAIVFVLTGCALCPSNERVNGRMFFQTKCVVCHGQTGRGDGPLSELVYPHPVNLAGQKTQAKSDAELKNIISRTETGPMSIWNGTFSDEEITALVAYIRSLP